ncbi:response regulator [Lichenihabitans sp. Uapishka_5]|uniref:response regulator n=1 Tax=Lichenihabitans sp. Uapishka_5 TaxID=3037302 RepID=UPI0029E811E3|nr:response regulator [Lichenihabitans sp. Uapishka_5]MDX7952707.1 response regulator [Lichenihabitans sp. Uapishka_5]
MEPNHHPDASKLVALVEDEPIVRDVAAVELEDRGFSVVEFESADAALPYLQENGGAFSLVVTDVQMPGRINGLELVIVLQRWWPQLKVLVTSGGPLVNPSLLPPTAKFIAKPWRAADMASRVQELVAAGP